jgi:hypothetical protein
MNTKINYGSVVKNRKLDNFVKNKIINLLGKVAQKKKFKIELWMKDETGKKSRPEFTSTLSIQTPMGKNIFVKCTDSNIYRSIKKSYLSAQTQMRRNSQVLKSRKTETTTIKGIILNNKKEAS